MSQNHRNVLSSLWVKYQTSNSNLNFEVNNQPRYVTYTNPGLNYYTHFDKYGLPDLTQLIVFTMQAESFADKIPCLLEDDEMSSYMYNKKLHENHTTFVASTEFEFSRMLYNPDIPKWPLKVKVSFGGYGTSSILTKTQIYAINFQEPIITKYLKFILIEPKSRRPSALPEWYREKLKGKEENMPDFKFTGFKKAIKTFVRRIQVVHSDIDQNNHTNFSKYVQYGLDTLHLALLKKSQPLLASDSSHVLEDEKHSISGMLGSNSTAAHIHSVSIEAGSGSPTCAVPYLSRDLIKQGVKNLKICYPKESLEGDILDVHIWQEMGEELKVRCSIEMPDGSPICQFILEYFTLLAHL